MGDYRVVQCFGTKVRPKKPARACRKKYMWVARGTHGNFGRKGAQACPSCGTMPDFTHPINRLLNGEIDQAQAKAEFEQNYNPDGTKKNP